ncbi:E3 binding domain-containing protein [Deinococcus sp.]|uniref:E3 binding domain-containing protein n=1 Tax=Deinococcus sp. TaxID=47478 RepID=UPI0025BC31FC|nr:E3 binding domain-containing protein [Deinococcus sp.]
MERIAPLAKILAEANGIDWQKLNGTGSDGMIVEQDILNYLSRVMSGEEDPPSTPVDPTPAGWTGDEIPSADILNKAGMNADMLSRAGVDSDITPFVEQARTASPQLPATPPASTLADVDLEFELDDRTPVLAAPQIADTAAPGLAASLGSQLSLLYPKLTPETAPQATAPAITAPAITVSVTTPAFTAPMAAEPEVTAPPLHLSDLTVPDVQVMAPAAPSSVPAFHFGATPAVQPEVPEARPGPDHAWTPAMPTWTDGRQADDHAWTEPAQAAAPATDAAPIKDAAPVKEAQATPAAAEEEPIKAAPAGELQPDPEQEPQVLVAPVVVAATNSTQVVHAPGEVSPANAVWFGAYLRRDANVAALHDLQGQVSAALNQALPLGLLVARAAVRHADTLNLGRVAVQGDRHTHPVGTGSLRDALAQLDTAYDGDAPDLLIVDASAHGLDDLHYPHTLTLSVGRTHDGRAPLSLNGDVDAARAAKFLAQVAGTLEQPILLVL